MSTSRLAAKALGSSSRRDRLTARPALGVVIPTLLALTLAATAAVATLAGLAGPILATPTSAAATTTASRTLAGDYNWEQGSHRGNLEAVFTPTGDGRWTVAFHFVFDGQSHTYEGTAEGSLEDGPLAGEVQTDRGRRRFTFRGQSKDGSFTGTHAERFADEEERTGTLTLRP